MPNALKAVPSFTVSDWFKVLGRMFALVDMREDPDAEIVIMDRVVLDGAEYVVTSIERSQQLTSPAKLSPFVGLCVRPV